MVQSHKYYKFRAVGVKFEVGPKLSWSKLDRDLSVLAVLKKHDVFYSSEIPKVMWYGPLYDSIFITLYNKKIPNKQHGNVTEKKEADLLYTVIKFGGPHGVTVIVVRNGHGNTSSNPGRVNLHFT